MCKKNHPEPPVSPLSTGTSQRTGQAGSKPYAVRRPGRRGHKEGAWKTGSNASEVCRPPSPGESSATSHLMASLSLHVGKISVILEMLCAPGGAFLPAPANCMDPGPGPRRWLHWQLLHTMAAVSSATSALDAALAAQPSAAAPPLPSSLWGASTSAPVS